MSNEISEKFTNSSGWSNSVGQAESISAGVGAKVITGLEASLGKEGVASVKAKVETELSVNTEASEERTHEAETSGSTDNETGAVENISSSFSYNEEMTSTVTRTRQLTSDDPVGNYKYVHTGEITVYSFVIYDPATKTFSLNVYNRLSDSVIDTIYVPDSIPKERFVNGTLSYDIDEEAIRRAINSAYYVKYDGTEAEGGKMDVSVHPVGQPINLTKCNYTKTGYSFGGWWTNPDYTGTRYQDEDALPSDSANPGETITLYAQLVPNTYHIKYDANKPQNATSTVSDLPDRMACTYDKNVTLSSTEPTLKGYNFEAWYDENGKVIGEAGAVLKKPNFTSEPNGEITLYAKWTANNTEVKLDSNSSSIKVTPTTISSSATVAYDSKGIEFSVPTAGNYYKFAGWYTAASGGTQVTDANGKLIGAWSYLESKKTLYAHWTQTYPDYIYVSNSTELSNIRNNPGKAYMLVKDISITSWSPIPSFSGTLNGDGHTITGMGVTIPAQAYSSHTYYGFIGINSGTIKNLKFKDAGIYMETMHDGDGWVFAGVVCGHNYTTIDNVKVYSSYVVVNRTNSEIGIISGANFGTISNTQVLNGCEVFGNGDMGGITGAQGGTGTVTGCLVDNATVHYYFANDARQSGGAIGYNNQAVVSNTSVTNTKMILEAANSSATNYYVTGDNVICQGYIVGLQNGGAIKSVGGGESSGCSKETVGTDFICNGFLCLTSHYDGYFNNNLNDGWGYAGRIIGSCTIS